MTFEQFRATRTVCADLTKAFPGMCWEDGPAASGLVYLDELYIEDVKPHWAETARKRGKWYLILCNEEFVSDDLTLLERRLYEYAKSEGFCDPEGE